MLEPCVSTGQFLCNHTYPLSLHHSLTSSHLPFLFLVSQFLSSKWMKTWTRLLMQLTSSTTSRRAMLRKSWLMQQDCRWNNSLPWCQVSCVTPLPILPCQALSCGTGNDWYKMENLLLWSSMCKEGCHLNSSCVSGLKDTSHAIKCVLCVVCVCVCVCVKFTIPHPSLSLPPYPIPPSPFLSSPPSLPPPFSPSSIPLSSISSCWLPCSFPFPP